MLVILPLALRIKPCISELQPSLIWKLLIVPLARLPLQEVSLYEPLYVPEMLAHDAITSSVLTLLSLHPLSSRKAMAETVSARFFILLSFFSEWKNALY
jgi:hypothetical protein